jgi:hypothetical protein
MKHLIVGRKPVVIKSTGINPDSLLHPKTSVNTLASYASNPCDKNNKTFLYIQNLTTQVWLFADFEAPSYQAATRFNKSKNLETKTTPAINYTAWPVLVS